MGGENYFQITVGWGEFYSCLLQACYLDQIMLANAMVEM